MITLYDKAGTPHDFEASFKQEMLNVGYTEKNPFTKSRQPEAKANTRSAKKPKTL